MNVQELMTVAKGKNILVVEDSENISESLAFLMRKFFDNVKIAEDGKAGLEAYKEMDYDIVVTDLRMPIMNGIEMSREIKKIKPEQVIIVATAFEEEEGAEMLQEFDVEIFTKPINMEKFFDCLIGHLK
jgi:DNA-binding response OmpR family regulator